MKPIVKWMDVAEFAGHLVAYTTTSYYLGGSKEHVPGFPDVYIGYIGTEPSRFQLTNVGPDAGDECYAMDKLIPAGACHGTCAVAPEFIEGTELQMRTVTDQEVEAIHMLLESKQAVFCYDGGPAKELRGRNNNHTLEQFRAILIVAAWLGANITQRLAARQEALKPRRTVDTEYGLTSAQVECAVNWWAGHLRPKGETVFENGGTDLANLMAKGLAVDLNRSERERITVDQVKDFSILLGEFLESGGPYDSLRVDYSPCTELNLSLRRAGIKPSLATFPWKTSMYFMNGGVQVNEKEILLVDTAAVTA